MGMPVLLHIVCEWPALLASIRFVENKSLDAWFVVVNAVNQQI